MRNFNLRLIIIFFTVNCTLNAQLDDSTHDQKKDSLSYEDKLNSGNYYPYIKFTKQDMIKFPLEFQVELDVHELRDVDINDTNFYIVLSAAYHSILDTLVVTRNDSLYFESSSTFVNFVYPESDRTYDDGVEYDGKFKYLNLKDSLNGWSQYIETELPHKWDLRNYPFDKQQLKVVFESKKDTSMLKLNPFILYPPKIDGSKFNYLMDGLTVTNITTEKKYVTSQITLNYIEGIRDSVYEQLIFNIEIDRTGSYLYFKLFFGGFLSFLISFLVYFINPKNFDTRITLSLGGIFGADGNKYFVENSMPSLQVLTKADIINNLVIIFIIINIFIVIDQQTKNINLWKFEKNKFSAYTMFLLFFLFNLLVVLF